MMVSVGSVIRGDLILILICLGAGYVASIYTWPWLRTKLMGAKAEVDRLEARIRAIAEANKPQ